MITFKGIPLFPRMCLVDGCKNKMDPLYEPYCKGCWYQKEDK